MVYAESNRTELSGVIDTLDRWHIDTVCFDLDSTLVDTTKVFKNGVNDACGILFYGDAWARKSHETDIVDIVNQYRNTVFDQIILKLRPEFGINPVIGQVVIDICAKLSGIDVSDPRVEAAKERIREIYTRDIPPIFPGAKETVDLINATGRRTVLMTHAEDEWTRRKLHGNGLDGKFADVICFSIDRPKSEQYISSLATHAINPTRMMMVGDNFWADVWPVARLEGRAVWVSNGFIPNWSLEQSVDLEEHQEFLQESVLKIERISLLSSALLSPQKFTFKE